MKRWLTRFWGDESGLELSEYAVMLALIALAVIAIVGVLGSTIASKFEQLNTKLSAP